MMVPLKSTPDFQQGAKQQKPTPTLSKMSLNLTFKRKVRLTVTLMKLL